MLLCRSLPLALAALVATLAACEPGPGTPPGAGRASPDPAAVLAGLRPPVEAVGRPPVRWTLAERMAHYRVPGVSIAVIHDGRIAWARGFGVKEAGTADSVTPATLFQAASISKPVAATAMLRLVERGTLDLDADVNRCLTSWKVPENRFTRTEKVTLRRLVSHTAGLTVHGFPGYATSERVPTSIQVLDGRPPANTEPVRVDTTPGAIQRYSGGGTVVLQQLLEDVSGKPFPALVRELVLEPAGMRHSTFEQPLPAPRAAAAAHAHDGEGTPIPGGWHVYPEMAPAGLWTTPSDLAAWAIAVAEARAGRGDAILSREMAADMLTEQKDGAALGPFVGGSGRSFRFEHGGANEGFHSHLRMYPELGLGAVVMTNGDGGALLMREILLAIGAEYDWPEYGPEQVRVATLDSASLAGLLGEYRLRAGPPGGIPAEIRQEQGRLTLHAPQIPSEELLPESDSTFVMAMLAWGVTFTRDSTGRATGIRVHRPGGTVEGVRTQDVQPARNR